MHKSLIFALAAFAAAAPKPLLGLDLPVVSELDFPIVHSLDLPLDDLTKVEGLLTKVEDFTHLELPELEVPEVKEILQDLDKLIHLEIAIELQLPQTRVLIGKVESLVGDLPPVLDLIAEVEDVIASVLDLSILDDLPSVQDVLLEIDRLTEGGLKGRGLIVDVENLGIDILNSQDVVPLENTLSEFNKPSESKASPSPSPSAGKKFETPQREGEGKGIKYISTFDDLNPRIGQVTIQEVGPYNGLDYNGIDLVELGLFGTVVTGLRPNTPPNAAAYGLTTALLNGLPNITAEYKGSVVESFDFDSFYFGCVKGTVETIASEPLSCNVTVTGYKHEQPIAEHTFVYTFNTLVDGVTDDMIKAELPKSFKGLDTATFKTSYDVSFAIGATLLDTLTYITYTKEEVKAGSGPWPASESSKPSSSSSSAWGKPTAKPA